MDEFIEVYLRSLQEIFSRWGGNESSGVFSLGIYGLNGLNCTFYFSHYPMWGDGCKVGVCWTSTEWILIYKKGGKRWAHLYKRGWIFFGKMCFCRSLERPSWSWWSSCSSERGSILGSSCFRRYCFWRCSWSEVIFGYFRSEASYQKPSIRCNVCILDLADLK